MFLSDLHSRSLRCHIRIAEYIQRWYIQRMKLLRIYDCLCDATRLRLLNLLAVRSLCVCHIEAILRLPQARISRHLAYLRRNGMVVAEERGNWRIYALVSPSPAALTANLACLQDAQATEPILRRDRMRLEELSAKIDCDCATPGIPRRKLLRLAR